MHQKLSILSLILVATFLPTIGLSQQSPNKLTRPPEKFSKSQMQAWLEEERQKVKPTLPIRLVEAEEWMDYINHHHFVPLTLEGVPAGYVFDYNWVKDENPRRRLPTAEVTETGEFLIWWDRCNYYDLTPELCRSFIGVVVSHEAFHHDQWQRLAVIALKMVGSEVDRFNLPSTLKDLKAVEGAEEAFMTVWADGAHYQCREVEVYVTQIERGEISKKNLGEETFKARLTDQLAVYAYGNENSPGCANSIWAMEFADFLPRAENILRDNQIPIPQKK